MDAKSEAERPEIPHALIVEDNDQAAYLLQFLLDRGGFDTTVARNGREAEALLEADAPLDIVLLDLVLPHVDGFQLLMKVRELPFRAHLPVLILSGRTLEADIVRAFELGADDYVTKPFKPAELIARVRRLVRERSASTSR